MKSATLKFFDKSSSLLLLCFVLPLLFLPKINLIKLGGSETAGIRIDDVVLLFFSLIVLWARCAKRSSLHPIEKDMAAITALAFASFGINRLLFIDGQISVAGNLLYVLRPLEYFSFFYIGLLLGERLRAVMYALFFIYAVTMLCQYANLIGQFTNYGYSYTAGGRIIGLASFPAEMGALLNLMCAFFLFDKEEKRPFTHFCIFAVFGLLVNLTGSRVALFATAVIYLARIFHDIRQKFFVSICALGLGFLVVASVIAMNPEIYVRSQGLLSTHNIDLAKRVWEVIETHYEPCGNEIIQRDFESNDISWWIRIHKWCYALKIYVQNPHCALQGIGPGFATPALDGGLLRIFVEYGIIGVFLFFRLFKRISSGNQQLKWMVAAVIMNMVFFDAHLAYKPMTLLFLAYGASEKRTVFLAQK